MEASTTPHEIEPPSPEPVSIEGDPRDPADSPPATAEPPGMKIVTEFAKDSMKAQSREASTPTRGTPTPTTAKAGKKARPPPKSATSKKGTASAAKKPPNKKRKLDSESLDGAPSAKRSATPASSRASKTPAAANRMQSSTPAAASSSPPPIDRDAGEGGDIFCTCRRPDDHTWMIGCDGGCEDWFHGKCVKIKEEDGDLIDKYICPNCHAKGKGHTTWKRMCRLDGCRRPARLMKNGLIKYCSEEHGREFVMRRLPKGKKRRRVEEEEDDARSVGGVLSIGQLAAIATSVKSGDDFRTIGEGVLSPPPTAIVDEHGDYVMGDDGDEPKAGARFNEQEQKRTTRIAHALKDRAKRVLAELPGVKDICGFDSRLSWTEEEFLAWTASEVGQAAFSSGVLGAPPKISPDATDGEGTGVGAGVCQKKRCERHRQWRNIQAQDLKSEEASVAEELDQLMREELEVRERAKLRMLKEADGDREGRVEVVG
ncbi:MAG: hypothetical protein M1832_004624 [Thelocarpon impressellum]|nr:MAG: hypothetical protein M1832_004624 [Thelocarpon impressellum]